MGVTVRDVESGHWEVAVTRRYGYSIDVRSGVLLGTDLLAAASGAVTGRAFVVVDGGIADTMASRLRGYYRDRGSVATICRVPQGEAAKSPTIAKHVREKVLAWGIDRRKEPIVAVGGGATLDLAGYVASEVLRGVDWVAVPTTLLAMIDTALGGKVAVNHYSARSMAKNKVGAFHPAMLRLIDPSLLESLPAPLVVEGLIEMAKAALILDEGVYAGPLAEYAEHAHRLRFGDAPGETLLKGVIDVTARALAEDLFEADLARPLDLGHTVAHEMEGRASPGQMPHGIAVGHDLALTAVLSRDRRLIDRERCAWVLDLLTRLGMPRMYSPLMTEDMASAALADRTRHRGGRLRMVMFADSPDERYVDDIGVTEVMRAARELAEYDAALSE